MYQDEGSGPRHNVRRYVDVFRRHKILVLLPVIIALAVSLPLAIRKPHQYTSAAALWIDTAAGNGIKSSLDPTQNLIQSPAQGGQSTLNELLATRAFLLAVGQTGPLEAQLKAQGVPADRMEDKILGTLGPAISSTVVGPQILKISMTGTDPSIIPGTIKAVVSQYSARTSKEMADRQQSDLTFYRSQLAVAAKALQDSNARVTAYTAEHPGASTITDPTFSQIVNVATLNQQTFTALQNTVSNTQTAIANNDAHVSFHYYDEPHAPIALSHKKKIVFTGIAGLFAGLLVSALVLAALAASDRAARRPEDIEGQLGLEVVATVGDFPNSERDSSRARRRRTS